MTRKGVLWRGRSCGACRAETERLAKRKTAAVSPLMPVPPRPRGDQGRLHRVPGGRTEQVGRGRERRGKPPLRDLQGRGDRARPEVLGLPQRVHRLSHVRAAPEAAGRRGHLFGGAVRALRGTRPRLPPGRGALQGVPRPRPEARSEGGPDQGAGGLNGGTSRPDRPSLPPSRPCRAIKLLSSIRRTS